jgi:hypothetical protein
LSLAGGRVHVAGSAAEDCGAELLAAAHDYVGRLTTHLIEHGAGLVVGAGAEPIGAAGLPCTFDWTALEKISTAPLPAGGWPPSRPRRFVAIASQRGLERIPANRTEAWQRCCARTDFELVTAPPGWRMAGIIRERQLSHGDILVVLGGGAGVEHLAELYWRDGKPVVPVWAQLGAFNDDGSGGSRALYEKALGDPGALFRLAPGAGGDSARLQALRLEAESDQSSLAEATVRMLEDLMPPSAFYVRLLDPSNRDHAAVEWFFSEIVTPAISERGYAPVQMGLGTPESMFMNVEIFRRLHRAGVVLVDLTGMRPNCTMELGYALGRPRRVVISAQEGTKPIFDSDKLPTHFWARSEDVAGCVADYLDWFDRYVEVGPLVT